MDNICLTLAYDGTALLGWQKTPEGPSVEAILQQVLEQILQHPVNLQAASRTDAGVHALGQVVNFFSDKLAKDILAKLQISLNSLLPPTIVVRSVSLSSPTFHPTLDCLAKEYTYSVCLGPYQLPQHRLYSWHVHTPLQLSDLSAALPYFLGAHDFAAFTNTKKNEPYEHTLRTLEEFSVAQSEENRLKFTLRGPNFLYRMVRNLVGTAIDVGRGKIAPQAIPAILAAQDRTLAGVTAPPHGLCLTRVFY